MAPRLDEEEKCYRWIVREVKKRKKEWEVLGEEQQRAAIRALLNTYNNGREMAIEDVVFP